MICLGIGLISQVGYAAVQRKGARTYRMATAERLDVKKSKDLVTLEELERRDITYVS
jgi:hypothetical protein